MCIAWKLGKNNKNLKKLTNLWSGMNVLIINAWIKCWNDLIVLDSDGFVWTAPLVGPTLLIDKSKSENNSATISSRVNDWIFKMQLFDWIAV